MKKLVRAVVLLVVMFAGANAQAVRDQGEENQRRNTEAGPQCYYINGQWICEN